MPRLPQFPALLLAVLVALAATLRPGAAFTAAEASAPMTVTLMRSDATGCGADCPEWLALAGKIGFGTPSLLSAALARLGARRVPVLLDSPGGESIAALAMGRMIRAHRLDIVVASTTRTDCDAQDAACQLRLRAGQRPGHLGAPAGSTRPPTCASACVFLLAAGVNRAVAGGAYVGVHQVKQVLTFHPVMNTFRILSRMIGGHRVTVSKTLVASRPLPVRVVSGEAPAIVYSDIDRFLLGMGIDESIMPMMRATPPTGIHWMTAAELASTRVANDTTDPSTLLIRAAAPPSPAKTAVVPAEVVAADGRRWPGTVAWHVDRSAAAPALVAVVNVPEPALHGSLTVRRVTQPGASEGFSLAVTVAADPGGAVGAVTDLLPPRLCDAGCVVPAATFSTADGASGSRRYGVSWDRGDGFLMALRDRARVELGAKAGDGAKTAIDLSLRGDAQAVIGEWERLCCGLPPAPPPQAPAAAPPATLAARVLEAPATLTVFGRDGAPAQASGAGAATWFLLAPPGEAGGRGTSAALAALDVPSVGLRLSVSAGAAPGGGAGQLALDLHAVATPSRGFGPVTAVTALPAWDADSHPTLIDAGSRRIGPALFRVALSLPIEEAVLEEVRLDLTDAMGRHATLSLATVGPVGATLRAAARPADRPEG